GVWNAATLHGPHALGQGTFVSVLFRGRLDKLPSMRTRILFSLLLLMCLSPFVAAQTKIPAPQEVLGFTPGEDRKLASWNQVIDYFDRLDRTSDRVLFETLGNTSMGKPFVMATISSPANLARLEEFKQIQDQLGNPRKLGAPLTR